MPLGSTAQRTNKQSMHNAYIWEKKKVLQPRRWRCQLVGCVFLWQSVVEHDQTEWLWPRKGRFVEQTISVPLKRASRLELEPENREQGNARGEFRWWNAEDSEHQVSRCTFNPWCLIFPRLPVCSSQRGQDRWLRSGWMETRKPRAIASSEMQGR